MAFIDRRHARKGVYVYYHDKKTGKQKQIPRKLTKHLDKLPAEEIQAWVDKWEEDHGLAKDRSDRINLAPDDKLTLLWNQYQKHWDNTHARRGNVSKQETGLFTNHIVPFFVGTHQKKKPETWHDLVPAFHEYLFERNLSDQTVRYVLWALERFGKYLVWSRHMTFPFAIQVRSRNNAKVTPLKVRLEPDQVLKVLKASLATKTEIDPEADSRILLSEQQVKLSILLGYFAGLRPSEQWALEKSDFLTGAIAEKETKTLVGFREKNLGSKLSITVTKTWQRQKKGPAIIEELTKSHYSRGVVNIWNADAARMIAQILKDMPDGRLFPLTYDGMFQAWRRRVLPVLKVTAHDLRRASGLYLGRVMRLELSLLQDHLRHAEIETTMLYTREPEVPEKKAKPVKQDFDDVI